ncbi:MAG: glycosyltransferase family 4 protein [Thermoplasmata archaeon]|nr:MAG: glycosyltransferase family 4 protein [Thermoplasmata archaeon]
MKILMVAPEPFFQPRGTPFSVFHRTKALSKFGYKIDILTYHVGQDVRIPNTRIIRNRKVPFIRKIKLGPSIKKIIVDFFLFMKGFSLLKKGNYNYIHVHEEAGFLGIFYKKFTGLPMIYDMHSSIPEQMVNFNFSTRPAAIKIMTWVEKKIIQNADVVIGICPNLAETVHSIDPPKKTYVIENTPMVEDLKRVSETERKKFKKTWGLKGVKVILYTGTLEIYQGIELMIDSVPYVVKKYPDVKFVLVGGSPPQIEKLKKMVKAKNVEDSVVITGQRPFEEMSKFMAVADILLSPRQIGTNTPLKIYSYLKSGKPIVATNLLTHTQVLNDEVSVLTDPSPEAFGSGILKLLKNPSMGKRLGTAGRSLMKKDYSYEKYLEKTKAVYEYIENT